MCLEAPRATGGVECRIIGGFWEVEEPYDIASDNIGR